MRSGGLRCGWLSTRSVARLAESGRLLHLRGVVCSSPDSGLHVGGRLVAYRRVNEQRQESISGCWMYHRCISSGLGVVAEEFEEVRREQGY